MLEVLEFGVLDLCNAVTWTSVRRAVSCQNRKSQWQWVETRLTLPTQLQISAYTTDQVQWYRGILWLLTQQHYTLYQYYIWYSTITRSTWNLKFLFILQNLKYIIIKIHELTVFGLGSANGLLISKKSLTLPSGLLKNKEIKLRILTWSFTFSSSFSKAMHNDFSFFI